LPALHRRANETSRLQCVIAHPSTLFTLPVTQLSRSSRQTGDFDDKLYT
jgi:hypothetical protein